jgi:hypothetical protein
MYGVPEDLGRHLRQFHGQQLIQLGIGAYQVQFRFDEAGRKPASISAEGKWEVRDAKGALVDQSEPSEEREAYRVHRLLMLRVIGSRVEPPSWFELEFEQGYVLRVYDDSDEYESFSIQPGDVFV